MTPEKHALKRATELLIDSLGGLAKAARWCRVGKSVLAEYASRNHPDRFVPVDVLHDLEPLARDSEGWPHVTRTLCTLMGGVFVLLPESEPGREDLIGSLGRLAREHGKIAEAICEGLANDQVLDGEEAAVARERVRSGQSVLAALEAQLTAIIGDGARG